MTDIKAQAIQAVFTRLHTLGVTPEQAAAGVRLWRGGYEHPFQSGDFATLRGLSKQHPKGRSGHLGQRVLLAACLSTQY